MECSDVVPKLSQRTKFCLCFSGGKTIFVGYRDSDIDGDIDTRKPSSGYLFTFAEGVVHGSLNWKKCVALSTTEAKYIIVRKQIRSFCG